MWWEKTVDLGALTQSSPRVVKPSQRTSHFGLALPSFPSAQKKALTSPTISPEIV
ncbi:hypothetical protein R9C00_16835 [Flammeovirgaceae bacterium SG7u.111]|nr:hypothetical protein [Flammeovirgaceae bacterium SG7u.132]WPO33367.1 hypothetical protein R9C00_16835 [Flammeovirgaceae bacterium SG7u.111]